MIWWTLETLITTPGFSSARNPLIASRAHRNEPAQVDREHLVEVRAGELVGRSRDLDAGVVDEDVEAAEALGRLADHAHGVVLAGHVALDEHVADAVLLNLAHAGMHLLLGPCRLVGRGQVVDRDVGAVLGEAHGDRLADPGRATGDQQFLPFRPGMPTRRSCGSTVGAVCDTGSSPMRGYAGAVLSTRPRCDGRPSSTRGCASALITRADEPAAGGAAPSARAARRQRRRCSEPIRSRDRHGRMAEES